MPEKATGPRKPIGLRSLLLPPLFLGLLALGGCVFVVGSPLGFLDKAPGLQETTLQGEGDAKVLVIDISGFISDQPSQQAFGLVQKQSMLARVKAELKKAEKDDAIKALVLRINSPGGGVTASDEIYHLIKTFGANAKLPVVASLGSLAASGGYYIACSADEILAHPTTVTGSIGVILVGVNISGLMDKIGVENQTFTSGAHKDILSPLRGATPEERDIVSGVLDSLFQRFVSVVKESRPSLATDKIAEITDGRIFAADQAQAVGLVDGIGRIDDAIEAAKKRAGLGQARVVIYHRSGQNKETIYSRLALASPPTSLLGLAGSSLQSATSPQLLYLWRPGLQ